MAEEHAALNLRILSPSSEVEGGITFSSLSTATTVAQLRERIQDAIPSRPAPERMRLIYRGRVVANDGDTLEHVFGAANIRESPDQSLHLVLRELPPAASISSSPAPRPATLPPNLLPPASPSLQTNPFRSLPQPRPASQPHVHHHHHVAGGPVDPLANRNLLPMHRVIAQAVAQPGQPGQPMLAPGQPASRNTTPPQLPPNAPQLPPVPPANGRTVQQEGVGPNGERWTVTFNSTTNLPILPPYPLLPRPFAQPPVLGLTPRLAGSPAPSRVANPVIISRLRAQLQEARQELDNATTLLQSPSAPEAQTGASSPPGPPVWRNGRLLHHLQNSERLLGSVEQGLALSIFDPALAHHPDVLALRQSFHQLRSEVDAFSRMANRQHGGAALDGASSANQPSSSGPLDTSTSSAPLSSSSQPPAQASTSTMPLDVSPELFILSSPQGPVGVVFNQQGAFTTAPIVPTMTYQSFTDQFNRNRQLIAGLGQQITSGSSQGPNHLATLHPTPTQQPPNQPHQQQNQVRMVNQNRNQNQNQDQNQNANQMADGQADAQGQNIAAHLWLLFKLACFVYIFSGGGGWHRPIMLGTIAAIVYLAQLGVFDDQLNVARRHFEAFLPVGDFAERIVQRRANAQARHTEPIRNLTPQEAAQRLLQQQRDQRFNWVRESVRGVERALALFLASLWPGLGERIVRAEEDRARADRVAEEERVRLAEETRAREAEAEAKKSESEENKEEIHGEGETGEPSSSAKGKERAVVAEEVEAQALD